MKTASVSPIMHRARHALMAIPFLGAICLTLVSPAAAQTTSFAGLECVEANDQSPDMYYLDGRGLNNHPDFTAVIQCPIPRLESDMTGDISEIVVHVVDNHESKAVECYALSCDEQGTTCHTSSTVATAGTGISSMNLGMVPHHAFGIAYISCSVPDKQGSNSRSGIISYRATD